MGFYFICLTILLFFIIMFVYTVAHDIKEHILSSWFVLLFCVVLTILFKTDFGISFWGLEYEDAYSFSFCARQFLYDIYPSSFLIDAVSVGSLENPLSTFTYGGHFITYPAFISIFTNVLGWSPNIISYINTLTAFGILVVLSLLGKQNRYWFIAPILFCCAPIINVFTTCFLSETFSSFICITFIYAFFQKETPVRNALCFVSFGLALLCKRENLALGLIPILEWVYTTYKTKKNPSIKVTLKQIIPFAIIIIIYFFACQNVFDIERIESKDIGQPTFSIQNFISAFPVYVKSLLSINSFSITSYLYVGCMILHIAKYRRITKEILFISLLFLSYIFLYSSHYRGYFYTKGEQVSFFETYRYINNFFYLIPLSFSYIYFPQKRFKYFISILVILSIFSFYTTIKLRNDFSQLEGKMRFNEVEIISDYIKNDSDSNKIPMLISENILLYQNMCDDNFNICDITQIDQLVLDTDKYSYYCLLSDQEYLKERYNIEIDMRNFIPLLQLTNNLVLYKYVPQLK